MKPRRYMYIYIQDVCGKWVIENASESRIKKLNSPVDQPLEGIEGYSQRRCRLKILSDATNEGITIRVFLLSSDISGWVSISQPTLLLIPESGSLWRRPPGDPSRDFISCLRGLGSWGSFPHNVTYIRAIAFDRVNTPRTPPPYTLKAMAPTAIYDSPNDARESRTADPTPLQAISHGLTLQGIPNFKRLEEKRQWILEHMACAFRVFARHNYTEGMSGHISVMDPIESDAMWMNPLGVHFGMLKASDMILLRLDDGEIIGGNRTRPANKAGLFIHAAIHKARPDVGVICHTHSIHGKAWSTFARPLEMLNQDVCDIYGVQGVYAQYGGIVFGEQEGEKMAEALGPKGKGLILMNHGLLTVGQTVDEAAFLFRLMEKSCEVQLLAEAAAANGVEKRIISDEEAQYNFKMASEAVSIYVGFLEGLHVPITTC